MKKYKVVNETRFLLFIVFVLYVGLISFYFLRSLKIVEDDRANITNYEEVYIANGDTVWNIALEYKPNKYDVRDMVAEIKDFNELEDLSIKPGEVLKIPVRKRKR